MKKPKTIEENLENLIKISCGNPNEGCISRLDNTTIIISLSLLSWDEDGNLEVK